MPRCVRAWPRHGSGPWTPSPHLASPRLLHHRFSGREIPKSPFRVNVSGYAGDPSKVTASGPGLEPEGVMINRPTYFDIFTKGKWLGGGLPMLGRGSAPRLNDGAFKLCESWDRGAGKLLVME